MQNFVTQTLHFFERRKKHGGAGVGDFEGKCVAALREKFASTKHLSVAESNKVSTLLDQSLLSEDSKGLCQQDLLACTNEKGTCGGRPPKKARNIQDLLQVPGAAEALPGAAAAASKKVYQNHDYIENYFTEAEWQMAKSMIQSNTLTPSALATLACTGMTRCGWFDIEECDFKKIVGAFGCLGAAAPVCGLAGLETVKKLKKATAAARPKTITEELVRDFPEDPKNLPEPWLGFSQRNGPLVVSPYPRELVRLSQSQTPGRNTHWSVKAQKVAAQNMLALGDLTTRSVPMLQHQLPQHPGNDVQQQLLQQLLFLQQQQRQLQQRWLLQQPQWARESSTTVEECAESPPTMGSYGGARVPSPAASVSPGSSRAASPDDAGRNQSMPATARSTLAASSQLSKAAHVHEGPLAAAGPATLSSTAFQGMAAAMPSTLSSAGAAPAGPKMDIADVLQLSGEICRTRSRVQRARRRRKQRRNRRQS